MSRLLISAILICTAVSRIDAAIVDTFSVPLSDQSVTSNRNNGFGTFSITQNGLSTTEVVGGERHFSVSTLNFPHPNDPTARVTATMNGTAADPDFDNTFLAPSHGSGTFTAETQIIWGNTTDLNLDIGTDTDFLLTLEDLNLSPITLINAQLSVTLETGGGTDTVNLALLTSGLLQPEYRFSGFTGVDFADIDRIILTLNATTNKNSSNFTVTYGAFASAAAIPEPSSYLLLGLTAIGAGLIARRKRRQTTEAVPEECDVTPTT